MHLTQIKDWGENKESVISVSGVKDTLFSPVTLDWMFTSYITCEYCEFCREEEERKDDEHVEEEHVENGDEVEYKKGKFQGLFHEIVPFLNFRVHLRDSTGPGLECLIVASSFGSCCCC